MYVCVKQNEVKSGRKVSGKKSRDALYEMVAPVDEDDFYSDVYRAWFEEIAWNWELEKEGFLPEEKDPFSERIWTGLYWPIAVCVPA